MTMRAIADKLGVSVPTLYRRLKAEGVNVADLRDDKTGKVTAAGASMIADLFRDSSNETAFQDILNGASQSVSDDTSRQDDGETVRAAVCAARLEAAEATIVRLEDEVARLRVERDRLLSMLEQEQAQRVRLLEDGQRQRRGLLSWFRKGRGEN